MNGWLTGRRGQGLAVGALLLAVAVVWAGIVSPVQGWYEDRALILAQRQALLRHMQGLVDGLPALQAAAASRGGETAGSPAMMLPGATDAVAAADLQERVQAMASSAGLNLTAVETLPPTAAGERWRKVSLRISMNAGWPLLMQLVRAIEASPTRILIDDVHFHSPAVVAQATVLPIQASMVLYGFRATDAAAGT